MKNFRPSHHRAVLSLLLLNIFAQPSSAWAALADLSDNPLASSSSAQIKPNIMFILDDSGSMGDDAMPDNVPSSSVGQRNHLCNYIYYSPSITYTPPVDSAGTNLNNASPATFTSALVDGYYSYDGAASTRKNLSSAFRAGDDSSDRAAYYWDYVGPGTPTPLAGACIQNHPTSTSATGVCSDGTSVTVASPSNASCTSGTLNWKKTLVSTTSGSGSSDETQNFANWYSYYRLRLMMMKAAAGRSFVQLSDSYRVGFLTIYPYTGSTTSVSSSKFLKITDFDSTQKTAWFSKLYSQNTNSNTPLRTAISRAGRYFAGMTDGINAGMINASNPDPIQYSCQQNFSILTTDGYWNSTGGFKLDGTTAMDNQDGNLSELDAYNPSGSKLALSTRPIYDGASTSADITVDISNAYQQKSGYPTSVTGATTGAGITTSGPTSSMTSSSSSGCTGSKKKYTYTYTWTYTWTGAWTFPYTFTYRFQYRPTTTTSTTTYSGNVALSTTTANSTGSWADATWLDSTQTVTYSTTNGTATATATATTSCQSAATPLPSTPSTPATPSRPSSVVPTAPSWPTTPASGRPTAVGSLPAPTAPCTAWPCTTTNAAATGGSSDSLSDAAQYYYKTDLRNSSLSNCTGALGTDVCINNVPGSGTSVEDDKANWQHMTTFTMGLGLSGTLTYQSNYKSAIIGDFADLRSGAKNWPLPVHDSATALDDLWHAAVNGRGQYFSAGNPDTVISGLLATLAGINARVASAAAAATSNLEPVAGDNFAYTAKYVSPKWTGELEAHEIDLSTGVVGSSAIWSAQAKLDTQGKTACDTRTIKLFRSGATDNLVDFKWSSDSCNSSGTPLGSPTTTLNATEQAYFGATQAALLSQYPAMTDGTNGTDDQRTAARGANLVNYLRGQRGKETFIAGDLSHLYRAREHIMGDIVNAQPVYVRGPFASYTDIGYGTFKTNNSSRTPMVYTAANDGMLHGFYAGTSSTDTQGGVEAWAFIPTTSLPSLYKLATDNYANLHTYSVDGTPSVGDVFDTTVTGCSVTTPTSPESCWKTILVAGLNKGGKGYYALDITDPAAPKALWEFNFSSTCYNASNSATWGADCHIGYTYNNPLIGKLSDGTWAVFVTSGYNNVNSPTITGDGLGYLYVLNAVTGKIIYKMATTSGDSTTPSGLNHIAGWVDDSIKNNTISRIYGGDLLGNVWRFDINDTIAPSGREATKLAALVDSSGATQPITSKPELGEINSNPWVYIGTGRYLGTTDLSNTQTQSVYAIKDNLDTNVAVPRSTFREMTITDVGSGTTAYRTIACTNRCASTDGWYADLPDSGERVNIDIKLQLGTLVVASNVPQNNACNIGGYSWVNYFNYTTGANITNSTNQAVGIHLADALVVGLNIVRLPTGKTVVIATTSDANQKTLEIPFDQPPPQGKGVSWRELWQ